MAFLATLPNDRDSLAPFYEPIQEKLVEVFKNEKLTPMKRGGHAAASGIFRGSARLSDLISDKDLATILGKNRTLSLWASNAPQQNQREGNFLSLLEIPEWNEEDLVSELSNQPDLVMRWLKKNRTSGIRNLCIAWRFPGRIPPDHIRIRIEICIAIARMSYQIFLSSASAMVLPTRKGRTATFQATMWNTVKNSPKSPKASIHLEKTRTSKGKPMRFLKRLALAKLKK